MMKREEASPEREVYDRLWQEALACFAAGEVDSDPVLLNREADYRYGISLIARPAAPVRDALDCVLATLRQQEPEQHYYRPDELHVTVLTLVTCSTGFDLCRAPLDLYNAVLTETLRGWEPIPLHIRGVTASPAALMAQGFAPGDRLNALRESLRGALRDAGLADTLDQRYRSRSAHITMARFCSPPRDLPGLVQTLAALRARDFGATSIHEIEFVFNDWYMSHDKVELLARYPLPTE